MQLYYTNVNIYIYIYNNKMYGWRLCKLQRVKAKFKKRFNEVNIGKTQNLKFKK